jgi:putative transposase
MGLQVSCGVDTQIQKEGSLWGAASRTGRGIQGTGKAEGEQDRRRTSAAGSYIARTYMNRRKNFIGENFWARGYYVSTTGKDEEVVRRYIQQQEAEDRRIDQLKLFE